MSVHQPNSDIRQRQFISLFRYTAVSIHQLIQIADSASSSAYSDTRQCQLNPNDICKGKQSVQVHSSLKLSETFKTPPPYRIKWKKVKNIRPPKKP
ncbi:MAG: hypothetical protein HDS73_02435 [Bacteroidales bacterium]|nr:hypothetical protein [Bacteroidales bacterium]